MKKSLVILSISLILLISISFVSASWFSELFSGKAKTSGSAITQDFQQSQEVKKCFLCNIFPTCKDGVKNQDETGVDCGGNKCPKCEVKSVFPTCKDGVKNQDETGVDCGGNKCPKCEVKSIPLDSQTIPDEGGDLLGGESCEILDLEELYISPGNVGIEALNNRFIDFNEDEELIIDETFRTKLKEGNSYLIPIPNQECYWKADYDGGELYMVTVCPVSE